MKRNKSVRKGSDPQMKKKWFGSWALGCVVMGGAYILTYILLGLVGFTHDAVYPNRPSFSIQGGNWTYLAIFSSVLFLLPFALGAWFLRWRFREECRPVGLITAGLLAAWAGEKSRLSFCPRKSMGCLWAQRSSRASAAGATPPRRGSPLPITR